MTTDPLDPIMQVMDAAFDPAFGEAWTRRQVADALALSTTHALIAYADQTGMDAAPPATGFALSRQAADEEELLLIAVVPHARGQGIGTGLLQRLFAEARQRGSRRLFLEMREGNRAAGLYRQLGFQPVGRRPGYYHRTQQGALDAITFARLL